MVIPLGGTQSRLANLNNLCHSPKVKGQCKKKLIYHFISLQTQQTNIGVEDFIRSSQL